jgi:hypothetical protein
MSKGVKMSNIIFINSFTNKKMLGAADMTSQIKYFTTSQIPSITTSQIQSLTLFRCQWWCPV